MDVLARKAYSTDLTEAQWTILEPLIPASKHGGRPREVNMREVINTICISIAPVANGKCSRTICFPRAPCTSILPSRATMVLGPSTSIPCGSKFAPKRIVNPHPARYISIANR